MGAILEPTPDMGTWTVEVRRESAYLNGDTLVHRGNGFAILDSDCVNVVAAIDQIMTHSAYVSWLANHTPDDDNWHIEAIHGRVRLHGPAIVYGGHEGPWTSGEVELPYQYLADLKKTLGAVTA